jgi:hypothetical protein
MVLRPYVHGEVQGGVEVSARLGLSLGGMQLAGGWTAGAL